MQGLLLCNQEGARGRPCLRRNTQPDQFDVYYENALVFSTNTPISGSNTVQITYGPGTSTQIKVVVTGPEAGTLWDYQVSCPTPPNT